jgi:hypothetical protein
MRLLTYLILISLLPACGELSYKRGGSQQDIDRAHQACRGAGDQLATCLAEHGWQKPKEDAKDPLFATIEASDNRAVTISKPTPFIEIVPEKEQKKVAPVVAKTTKDTPTTTNTSAVNAQPANTAVVTSAAQKEEKATPSHSTVNDGPDVEYKINSWWKMGAFPKQLKQDQLSCENKLGTDYLPDYKTQTFKRAFVVCMHDLGWQAIRDIK